MTNSRKILIIIALVFSVSLYAYFFLYHKAFAPAKIQELKKENIVMVPVNTQSNYSIATGEYPQFNNTEVSFNKKIADIVENAIKEHSIISEENWIARFETKTPSEDISKIPNKKDRFSLDVSTSIVRNDSDVISFKIDIYEFSGGAHGNTGTYTFNYDVKRQKEMTLLEIGKGDTQFLQKLSKQSRVLLRADLAKRSEIKPEQVDIDMLNSGTTPEAENFSLFTLPEDGKITFHFTAYQVAPYVFGPSEITLDLPIK